VCDGLADWVDFREKSKGIIAREILPRSEPSFAPAPLNPALPPVELHGVVFEDPELSEKVKAERARLVQEARMISYFGPEKGFVQVNAET